MNINYIKKLMDRKKTSRKGENGSLLIIGGSEENVGSVTLAGLAALRAGCDIVTIAAPEKIAWAINAQSPDLITKKIKAQFTVKLAKEMVKRTDHFDAILIGNGITSKADKFCQYFIKKSQKLKIIDSDPLKSLTFKDFGNSIVTPNEEELEKMLINGNKEFLLPKLRESSAKEKAEILQGNLRYFLQNDNVLLLKGSTDLIISKNRISYNRTGNQGMTKTGTGDVLAGIVAGFLAMTGDLFKSAVAGSYINGMVGDELLKKKRGYNFIASDIVLDLERLNLSSKKTLKGAPKSAKAKAKAPVKLKISSKKSKRK